MGHGVIVVQELRRDKLDRLGFTLVRLQFADRVSECLQQRVVLYQSRSRKYQSGYFASATLVDADVYVEDARLLFVVLADIETFHEVQPISVDGVIIESYVRNDKGHLHGRRFAEDVRRIPDVEFQRIVSGSLFVQIPPAYDEKGLNESDPGRDRVARETWARDMIFRGEVLPVYNAQCAITRQKLTSPNGLSSGLVVCHAQAVADGGKDALSNVVLLCPDFHYRWDAGSIDILDDYNWVPVGPHHDPIVAGWTGPRKLHVPDAPEHRLSPTFLDAHRAMVRRRSGRAG